MIEKPEMEEDRRTVEPLPDPHEEEEEEELQHPPAQPPLLPPSLIIYLYVGHFLARWGARFVSLSSPCYFQFIFALSM